MKLWLFRQTTKVTFVSCLVYGERRFLHEHAKRNKQRRLQNTVMSFFALFQKPAPSLVSKYSSDAFYHFRMSYIKELNCFSLALQQTRIFHSLQLRETAKKNTKMTVTFFMLFTPHLRLVWTYLITTSPLVFIFLLWIYEIIKIVKGQYKTLEIRAPEYPQYFCTLTCSYM